MNPVRDAIRGEFSRYRKLAEGAIRQLEAQQCNWTPAEEANSVTVLVAHLSGNLKSRFTDFLDSDGEKPWREREGEFAERSLPKEELLALWAQGWEVLEKTLESLEDADLPREVRIRRQPLTVLQALERSLAHVAYHVGQIVLLARLQKGGDWVSLSIPKGHSAAYNLNPDKEKPDAR